MSTDVLKFSCPSCQAGLTVPVSMAGVTGPCPRCSATIQAPRPLPSARSQTTPPAAAPGADRPGIRPLPRALPEGRNPPRISPNQSTTNEALRRQPGVVRARRSSASGVRNADRTLSRIAVPVVIGLALGLVIALVCYNFLPSEPSTTVRGTPTPPASRPADPMDNLMGTDDTTARAPAPTDTDAAVRSTESAPGEMAAGELDAIEALERFLNAPSFRERAGLIDPPQPANELENSILASPLPPVGSITATTPFHDKLTDLTVRPFRVTFRDPTETPTEFIVHVRTRRGSEPRIAVEPFLDLVGGRLAEFAATPKAGQQTFHAIVEGIPRCFEDGIPNPDRKFTYRLSASDSGQEIARAYASLNSRLAEDLYSQSSKIRWGVRKEATVILSWNFKEDPEQPYLQLDTIVSPDWNP